MSCGDPHDTDCSQVLDRIHEFLDHELDEGMVEKIQIHLDECGPCLAEADVEAEVKALVQRAGRSHAPDHLKARIISALQGIRVGAE